MKVKLCPKCGKQYEVDTWNCTDCGTTLSVNALVDISTQKSRKVRLCLKCGKQNDENAWNCADCGETLSVDNIVDSEDIKTTRAEISRKHALSYISPYFKDDYTKLLDSVLHDEETVITGCDITQYAKTPPFEFGYLILTSKKLICVSFVSDTTTDLFEESPQRSFLSEVRGTRISLWSPGSKKYNYRDTHHDDIVYYAIDRLDSPLTESEQTSRKVTTLHPKDLYSANLASDLELCLKIYHSDGNKLDDITFHCYYNNEAYEMQSQLSSWLK